MLHTLRNRVSTMKTLEMIEPETSSVVPHRAIQLPLGLLGFERVKNYVLTANPHEAPFQWLQMVDSAQKAFLVVSPFLVLPTYEPDIPADDVEFLGLTEPSDAQVLNICILRKDGQATINLKGPVVINRHTGIGKQVIPNNAAQYSLRHPLPVA